MPRYETLILTIPEITRDETADVESQFEGTVKKVEGSIISFERWGKYRLSYPVRTNEYGVYFLARFEAPKGKCNDLVKDLKALFEVKYPVLIMRSITTALAADQSLVYHKPESLEDAPAHDVDSFVREHKMEGLLSAIPSKGNRGGGGFRRRREEQEGQSEEQDANQRVEQ